MSGSAAGMASADPYLSIVVTGRNDDFGGDFNGRFFRALRFNRDHLIRAGIAHEFVFVEWRPIQNRPYLSTLLAAEFPELGNALRCYVVDAAYHDAVSLNARLQFQEFIAKNVGIRRARGHYVLTTNTDIYLSRGVIGRLASRSIEDGILYRAARYDLKSYSDVSHVDWNVLEDERNYDAVNVISPPLFTNASGDFLLLDWDGYHRLGGFNEVYRVAKIHIDGNFCLKAHASLVPLLDIGFPVYHVGRGTLHAQVGLYRHQPADAPWGDVRWKSDVIYVNGPTWGLASAPERRLDTCITAIDFDWNVVGPMVELGRIVSPGAVSSELEPTS
jgi:hypothetical protein